ncbi:hypothetical protein ACHAWX_002963 [Stephanocyclus meneghinianus]
MEIASRQIALDEEVQNESSKESVGRKSSSAISTNTKTLSEQEQVDLKQRLVSKDHCQHVLKLMVNKLQFAERKEYRQIGECVSFI